MDANTAITLAAPKSSDPHPPADTGSDPLVAESSPQRRPSRDKDESRATDQREAAELVSIEGRLMAKYGQSFGPDAVMGCIADAVRYFHTAPVRTYVMLLVERRATAQLRDVARRAAADPGDDSVAADAPGPQRRHTCPKVSRSQPV